MSKALPIAAMAAGAYFTGGTSLFGTAAAGGVGAMGPVMTSAATSGLFGAGGAFSLGTTLGTLGSLAGPASSIFSGMSEAAQSKSDAAIQARNAEIDRRNAEAARVSAGRAADEERADTARKVGSIKSAFGKAGVVTTAGSPLLAQETQAFEGELEAQKILFEGATQAAGYMSSAQIFSEQSKQSKSKAKSSLYKGILGAGTSLLN